MNWPLWKRELRGTNWFRFSLQLLAPTLLVAIVQAVRFAPLVPSEDLPPDFALGLLHIGRSFQDLYFGFTRWNVFPTGPRTMGPIALYMGLALAATTLVACNLSLRRRSRFRDPILVGMGPLEAISIRCVRPFLLLSFPLALLVVSECLLDSWLWDAVRLHHALERSVYELNEVNVQDSWRLIDVTIISKHSVLGLTVEMVLRVLVILALMVTAAFIPITRWPNRPVVAFAFAVGAAFLLGGLPQALTYGLSVAIRPPSVSSPHLREGSLTRTRIVNPPNAPFQGSFQYEGVSLGPLIRRGETAELPEDILRFLRDFRRRQNYEDWILLSSYLLPLIAWASFWLWWVKRRLLQVHLRE